MLERLLSKDQIKFFAVLPVQTARSRSPGGPSSYSAACSPRCSRSRLACSSVPLSGMRV